MTCCSTEPAGSALPPQASREQQSSQALHAPTQETHSANSPQRQQPTPPARHSGAPTHPNLLRHLLQVLKAAPLLDTLKLNPHGVGQGSHRASIQGMQRLQWGQ